MIVGFMEGCHCKNGDGFDSWKERVGFSIGGVFFPSGEVGKRNRSFSIGGVSAKEVGKYGVKKLACKILDIVCCTFCGMWMHQGHLW